jgi:hypothetical protein
MKDEKSLSWKRGVALARSIFHQVRTSPFEDQQKKNIEIMKATRKNSRKKNQKIALSSPLATGLTRRHSASATQMT